jgi:rod shape-determining protein MreD
MKRVGLILLVAIVVLIQVSWLPFIRPFGVVPGLVMVVVVLMALEHTTRLALAVAVAAGLALDLASGANFGLWTGLLVLQVLAAAYIRQAGIEVDGPTVPLAMVVVGTILLTVLVLLSLMRSLGNVPAGWVAARVAGELVINLGLVMLLRPLVRLTSDGASRG